MVIVLCETLLSPHYRPGHLSHVATANERRVTI